MLPSGTPTRTHDLARGPMPADALRDVDVVVHLAGIAHQQANALDYQALVVEPTRELARHAAIAGVRHFIYFSSVKAMGAASSSHPRSEGELSPGLSPYGAAKRDAEALLLTGEAAAAMSVSVIRPALVYGPSAKGNLALLARAARFGVPRPPAIGARSMVSLEALVDLVAMLVERPVDGRNVWIACDDKPYTTAEIYDLLRSAMALPERKSRLPLWLWRVALGAMDVVMRRQQDATYEKLFGTEVYSNQALREATGWDPGSRLAAWAAGVGVSA